MEKDPNYKDIVEIRTHLENVMKNRTKITQRKVQIIAHKKKIKDLEHQIELEERQLALFEERENGRTFKEMIARVEIGRVNFGASMSGAEVELGNVQETKEVMI